MPEPPLSFLVTRRVGEGRVGLGAPVVAQLEHPGKGGYTRGFFVLGETLELGGGEG